MATTRQVDRLRDPLLESPILGSERSEASIDPEEGRGGATSPEILLHRTNRAWIRYSAAFFTVGCIAVVCYSAAATVFVTDQATPAIASEHGGLKRATHAAGNATNVLPREVASCLHRTTFHFQPESNWMNDPNGPMYYKGYYHFFYQYNPHAAVWGDIVWGHAVSTDLIHWLYLDIALQPDQWYDVEGVWSGSVTVREDGVPVILYTGCSSAMEQTQNVATPSDLSDPLLRKWHKHSSNPILRHPPGISGRDFRDPTTAWKELTGTDTGSGSPSRWLMTVGAKKDARYTGVALLYESADLVHWKLHRNGGLLHAVAGTGMWECVDFYPVAAHGGRAGVQTYGADAAVKYVLKASLDADRHDYYALGAYDVLRGRFVPDDAARDCGLGSRYDYGKFYASKTFFDPKKQRRVLWGWVNESDSEAADIAKGWSSVQAIPRVVFFDNKTRSNLLQWPVEEVEELRGAQVTKTDVELAPGALVEVQGATGGQLDVELVFDYPNMTKPFLDGQTFDEEDHYDCHQGGAAHRGVLGPFGLLVLADEDLRERTAVFFYVSHTKDGTWRTRFCSDQSRSSLLPDIDTTVYGSFVEVHPSEDFLSLRVLVDRSIVESFVQGGRMVITSRVYPTMATDQAARLFLFNNATTAINVRSVRAWQMQSVPMHSI